MSSPLERTLLRLQVFSKGIDLGNFLKCYLSVDDMLSLRLTSRSLSRLAELNMTAFETLYIHTPVPPGRERSVDTLELVSHFCRRLVIKIAFPFEARRSSLRKTTSSDVSADSGSDTSGILSGILDSYCPYVEPPIAWKFVVQRKPGQINQGLLEQWCNTFKLFPDMETLHIACNGDPSWPGCTDIEALLIILRIALERTDPKHLHTVRLSPIHAMGIMHLRWAGAGAYGEAPRKPVWQRLKTLELEIINPYLQGRLSTAQKQLFSKVFADYLQSFSQTLIKFSLSWIGPEGPNPLSTGGVHQNLRLKKDWRNLKELWLCNVILNLEAVSEIKKTVPHLQRFMVSTVKSNANAGASHHPWLDYLAQDGRNENGGFDHWKNLEVVRVSAIPEPLRVCRPTPTVYQPDAST